jgi:hypothetical protein
VQLVAGRRTEQTAAMGPALGERDDCYLILSVRGKHTTPQWSPLLESGMTASHRGELRQLIRPQWSPLLEGGMTARENEPADLRRQGCLRAAPDRGTPLHHCGLVKVHRTAADLGASATRGHTHDRSARVQTITALEAGSLSWRPRNKNRDERQLGRGR